MRTANKGEKKVDNRVFELRTYTAAPGKMDALNARFRNHTNKLFEKHGMTIIGFWMPMKQKEGEEKLIYILAYPSKEAADKSWKAFRDDPEWQKARAESEKDGKLARQAAGVGVHEPHRLFAAQVTLRQARNAPAKGRKLRRWRYCGLFLSLIVHVSRSFPTSRRAARTGIASRSPADSGADTPSAKPGEAEQSGDCLLDLVVRDEYAGLGGRSLLTLGKRNANQPLPWTRLQAGTPVLLSPQGGSANGWRGVVCERGDNFVRVAFERIARRGARPASIASIWPHDEAARLRQRQALDRARTAQRDRLAELRGVLLGETPPSFAPPSDFTPLDALAQRVAARGGALRPRPRRMWPSFTGRPAPARRRRVVELIRQAVRRGDKVLVCAPSNLAVDNLLERCSRHGERAVRLGHPARVLPQLREHTLDLMVEDHSDVKLARKFAKEAFALFRQAGKWTRASPSRARAATCARKRARCSPTRAAWKRRPSRAS